MQAKPELPLLRMASLPQLTHRARTFFIESTPYLLPQRLDRLLCMRQTI